MVWFLIRRGDYPKRGFELAHAIPARFTQPDLFNYSEQRRLAKLEENVLLRRFSGNYVLDDEIPRIISNRGAGSPAPTVRYLSADPGLGCSPPSFDFGHDFIIVTKSGDRVRSASCAASSPAAQACGADAFRSAIFLPSCIIFRVFDIRTPP